MAPTIGSHPARLDLTVRAGERLDVSVPVLQAAGEPVPTLAGWTVTARAQPDTPGAEVVDLPVTVVGTSVRLTVDEATTAGWAAAWPVLSARWDLVLTDLAGDDHVLHHGWVRLYTTLPR